MIKIYKEKAGVISEKPIWICLDSKGYLYTDYNFLKLLLLVIKEWRNDRHLVG